MLCVLCFVQKKKKKKKKMKLFLIPYHHLHLSCAFSLICLLHTSWKTNKGKRAFNASQQAGNEREQRKNGF